MGFVRRRRRGWERGTKVLELWRIESDIEAKVNQRPSR